MKKLLIVTINLLAIAFNSEAMQQNLKIINYQYSGIGEQITPHQSTNNWKDQCSFDVADYDCVSSAVLKFLCAQEDFQNYAMEAEEDISLKKSKKLRCNAMWRDQAYLECFKQSLAIILNKFTYTCPTKKAKFWELVAKQFYDKTNINKDGQFLQKQYNILLNRNQIPDLQQLRFSKYKLINTD